MHLQVNDQNSRVNWQNSRVNDLKSRVKFGLSLKFQKGCFCLKSPHSVCNECGLFFNHTSSDCI